MVQVSYIRRRPVNSKPAPETTPDKSVNLLPVDRLTVGFFAYYISEALRLNLVRKSPEGWIFITRYDRGFDKILNSFESFISSPAWVNEYEIEDFRSFINDIPKKDITSVDRRRNPLVNGHSSNNAAVISELRSLSYRALENYAFDYEPVKVRPVGSKVQSLLLHLL